MFAIILLFATSCSPPPQALPGPTRLPSTPTPTIGTVQAPISTSLGFPTERPIVATFRAECNAVTPIKTERFKAGDRIVGPAILYPDKGFVEFAKSANLALPLSGGGGPGLAVHEGRVIMIPDLVEFGTEFTPPVTTVIPWSPVGDAVWYRTDQEMEFIRTCYLRLHSP